MIVDVHVHFLSPGALDAARRSPASHGVRVLDGETLNPLQEAFREHHGLQCGFCTPGFLMTLTCFLRESPDPSEGEIREAISGNLCRCTGYKNIVAAARAAAQAMAAAP